MGIENISNTLKFIATNILLCTILPNLVHYALSTFNSNHDFFLNAFQNSRKNLSSQYRKIDIMTPKVDLQK